MPFQHTVNLPVPICGCSRMVLLPLVPQRAFTRESNSPITPSTPSHHSPRPSSHIHPTTSGRPLSGNPTGTTPHSRPRNEQKAGAMRRPRRHRRTSSNLAILLPSPLTPRRAIFSPSPQVNRNSAPLHPTRWPPLQRTTPTPRTTSTRRPNRRNNLPPRLPTCLLLLIRISRSPCKTTSPRRYRRPRPRLLLNRHSRRLTKRPPSNLSSRTGNTRPPSKQRSRLCGRRPRLPRPPTRGTTRKRFLWRPTMRPSSPSWRKV